jgi:RecA/RadA recombinase
MAKKKTEEVVEGSNIEKIAAHIKKNSDNISVFSSVEDVLTRGQVKIPWSPSIDKISGGGIRSGSWMSLGGRPKTGKTTSLLTLAANAQALGYTVVYANVEMRLKDMNLNGVRGLDLSSDKFRVLESKKGKILSSVDYLSHIEHCLKNIDKCLVIIDSISALTHPKMFTDGLDTQLRGANNQHISNFCNICAPLVTINEAIVCGVVHLIANTGAMPGAPTSVEKSSNRYIYQCDYRYRIRGCSAWTVGEKQIGVIPQFHCEALAGGGYPGLTSETYVRFGMGVDSLYELINDAVALNLIQASGSWYSINFLDEADNGQKFQGMNNLYEAILAQPTWENILQQKIKEFLNAS